MTYEHLSVFVWTVLDLSGSYSCVLVNSDLSSVNSDLSPLSVLSGSVCYSYGSYSVIMSVSRAPVIITT